MDTPISNVLFNIITLVNALIHFCLLIFVKVSFKPGGWFYNIVFDMVQMSMIKSVKTVRLMDLLIPTPTQEPYFILDPP